MKFSMTGQENGDLLTQVTVWTGLTVLLFSPQKLLQNYTGYYNISLVVIVLFFVLQGNASVMMNI